MKNLKDILKNIDEKYGDNPDVILGKNVMTLANRVNSSRGLMLSNNLDQALCLLKPESPRVSTMYEDLVGEYSSAYLRAKHDYVIIDKIDKFESKKNHSYFLIVYDKEKKMYDVIEKPIAEKLTENHGYLYDTKVMDSYDKNDIIEKGNVIYKSTSYDDYMNYRYGINLSTMYVIDDTTIEDAIVISESAAKKLKSIEIETVRISLNDNDILINLYGDDNNYKAFPDICEKVKDKMLAVKRRITYSQSLYDLNNVNIKRRLKSDTPCKISSDNENVEVIDINVYSNKELDEINNGNFNKQIIKYLKNDLRYHKEIVEKLGKYVNGGKNVSYDLDYMYKRSYDILDPSVRWKDANGNMFNNIILEFTIKKECCANDGTKLTGRYGDKGVVSKILPDEEMPWTETGEHVEMLCNALGVCNRLNGSLLYEIEVNFLANRIRERMSETDDVKEKELLLFSFIKEINEKQFTSFYAMYKNLSMNDKNEFLYQVEKYGLVLHLPPFKNIEFDQLAHIYEKFGIQPYKCYVNKFGRKIKMMNKMVVGEKYVLKLKHTPKSKTTARSTGYVNSKELPFKTAKNNRNIIQKTAVRIGEMEFTNLLLTMKPELLSSLSMMYSTSIQARRDTGQLFTNDVLNNEDIKIDKDARNRASEILQVYLNSIGMELVEVDNEEEE